MLGLEPQAAPAFSSQCAHGQTAVRWRDSWWEMWRFRLRSSGGCAGGSRDGHTRTITLREPTPAGTGHRSSGIRYKHPSSQRNLTPGREALLSMPGCPRLSSLDAEELGKAAPGSSLCSQFPPPELSPALPTALPAPQEQRAEPPCRGQSQLAERGSGGA